ncbi:hypothetical protein [Chryseobacterium sp. G0201]|uniref:hypothetical protein n=1 Tax=Chryseobacterium sp. G0201 TaxID=2487065 RepID=UPI000F4E8113|nr:hypothetical protein [Chryseobacterium sp. G0201]AZA55190.1 hypothetical protein EG348_20405 [Chryseobacterium sp. G0201]
MEAINQNNSSQTLFRFATMRNAELSDPKNKERRFIFRDYDTQKGLIDKRVELGESLQKVCENPTGLIIETEQTLKEKDPAFYELAVWVARNKASATKTEFDKKIVEYKALQQDISIDSEIWSNLVYQVVTQKDFYAKETLMQFLHLNHILLNYDGVTQEQYEDVVKAKVVLPKELFKVGTGSSSSGTVSKAETITPSIPFSEGTLKSAEATINLKGNQDLTVALEKLEKAYHKEYGGAYAAAHEKYLEEVRPAQAEYDNLVKEQEYQKEIFLAADNKEGLSNLKYIPVPKVAEFKFDFRPEIQTEELLRNLGQENLGALSRIFGTSDASAALSGVSTFTELFQAIDQNSQLLQNTIVNNTVLSPQVSTTVGGVVVPVTNTLTNNTVIPFTAKTLYITTAVGHAILLATDINDPKHIVSGNYQLKDYNQQVIGSASLAYTFDAPNVTSLFNNSVDRIPKAVLEKYEVVVLEGEVTLNDGLVYMMQATLIVTGTFHNEPQFTGPGTFTLKDKRPDNPTDPTDPEIPANPNDIFIPSGFGMKNIGVADYRKVEQSTYCYVEGDVAHIENIMAREYKERSTRRLKRSESQVTKSTESEKEKLTDTTSTERNEMQSEVSRILQESKDFAAQAGFSASWGSGSGVSPKFMLNTAANYATHNSREESNRQAVTEAKDVTARALDRIITKVKEERIDKILEEYEENNKHGFDNTKGSSHVVGVYRWVDKVVKNQIFNYGKRMMFEFMVPEPAKLHSLGMKISNNAENQLVKPIDPREAPSMQIKDWSALTDSTKLKYWLGYYNVEVDEKLEPVVYVGKSIDYSSTESKQASSKSDLIAIPEHYITESYVVRSSNSFPGYNGWGNGASLLVGGDSSANAFLKFVREVPITIATTNAHYFHATVNIKCVLQEEYKNGWMQKAFNKIMEAYNIELAAYEAALADAKAVGVQIKGSNPGFYRKIENTILRRNCISYMLNQNPNALLTFGKKRYYTNDNAGTETFTNADILVNHELDQYSAFIKFMEQAFEWEIMSYNFYSYYWGERKSWADLYQFDDNDPIFRAFMQSGMARVIVTVRPGFEEAVRHFLSTGQIWNGGEVPVIDDELFLSLVDEMRSPKATKEGEPWREKIPTSLTILQADSIGLKVEKALPCNCEPGVKFDDNLGELCGSNFELNDSQIGQTSDNWIEISFDHMDWYKTVGEMDTEHVFPRTYKCLENTIPVDRDASWLGNQSSTVFYKTLADEISLIEGVEALPTGNNGVTFKVNISKIKTFTFTKPGDDDGHDTLKFSVDLDASTLKIITPEFDKYGRKRILDKNGQIIPQTEYLDKIPLSKFLL